VQFRLRLLVGDMALVAPRRGLWTGAVVAAAYVVAGPLHSEAAAVTITATLTDEGVECQALRGDDGTLYTIRRSNAVRAFRTGDRVRVEGNTAEISICQQGVTIDVTRLTKAD
jgi:hypothetical protein